MSKKNKDRRSSSIATIETFLKTAVIFSIISMGSKSTTTNQSSNEKTNISKTSSWRWTLPIDQTQLEISFQFCMKILIHSKRKINGTERRFWAALGIHLEHTNAIKVSNCYVKCEQLQKTGCESRFCDCIGMWQCDVIPQWKEILRFWLWLLGFGSRKVI